MRKFLRIGVILGIVILMVDNGILWAQKLSPRSLEDRPIIKNKLLMCGDKAFGIKFLCDPGWDIYTDEDAILIIMSSDPRVTLTISRYKTSFVLIEQLGKDDLEKLGQYLEGFRLDIIPFADRKAIKVRAFSKESPHIRLLDYYLIKKDYLYNLLFAVNPKEEWDNYKFLIKEVSDSFNFLKYSERTQLK